VCAWLDFDGFVIGREGTLRWHGATDAVRLGILVGCAVVTVALKARVDRRRPRR
jgi:hypothetical protein